MWTVGCGLWAVEMSRVKGGPVSLILEGRKVCLSVKECETDHLRTHWDEPPGRAVHRPAGWTEVVGKGHCIRWPSSKVRIGVDMPHRMPR